ncbi:glycine cleavage system protein GcvH [Nocardiopsis trehalosi]|uniref:glycine cleavage system protein GcvH n=1 Tax=Nocardiopsis trehalosi TaxID=109329 RepID=UPI000829A2A3|nr:glycine cleavage system protein GcvH [Nocardiopsis trehalosi]
MTNIPEDLRYTSDHEWVRDLGKGRVAVGLTEFATRQLGDIVFLELPAVGDRLEASEAFGSVESVKAVAEVYAPVTGEVTAANTAVVEDPELCNTDPYGDGWLVEIAADDPGHADTLMSAVDYRAYCEAEEG